MLASKSPGRMPQITQPKKRRGKIERQKKNIGTNKKKKEMNDNTKGNNKVIIRKLGKRRRERERREGEGGERKWEEKKGTSQRGQR